MTDPFVRAVEAIYMAAAEPSRWPQTLQKVADCFDDVGAVMIYGRDDGSFGVIGSPSLTAICEEYAKDGWGTRDIRANRGRERGFFVNNDTITDRDILTPEEMKTDPFYAELLPRHGLKYFVCALASPDPHVVVGISVQRRIDKPEFTDDEIGRMNDLGRHIENSLRLSIRLMDAELSKLGLAEALSRVGMGVFVLDSVGRVTFSNTAADALLGDGIHVVNERLSIAPSAVDPGAEEATRQNLVGRADMLAQPKPILVHRRAARPLMLYVLPIPNRATGLNTILNHARAVVLAIDPESDGPADPSVIRDVLGLTLSEAKLAALIGTGLAPRGAAEKLGISEETARTVLKRVFAKVGVSRQSELAALLTRLVLK